MITYFGENLKQLRIDNDLTLREFARKSGYDVGNLSKVERGILNPPPTIVIRKWAEILGLERHSIEYADFITDATIARNEIPGKSELSEATAMPVLYRSHVNSKLTYEEFECLVEALKRNLVR